MKLNLNAIRLISAASITLALAACSKHSSKAQASTKSSAAPKAAKVAPKPLGVADFLAQIPAAGCKALDACKNDKVKTAVEMPIMAMAGFGSMDNPALAKQMKAVGKAMSKAENKGFPTEQHCEAIGKIALEVTGLVAKTVKGKIGKTVKYDAQKAAACLAAIHSPFPACSSNFRVKDPTMGEAEKYQKAYGSQIDAHTEVCNGALVGLLAAGKSCEYDYECAGENSKCTGHGKKKVCVAASAHAK